MGRDLALEELRISHDCPVGHGDQSKFWIFRCKNVTILDKNCALRVPRTTGSTTDIAISPTDAKSDEPAKMTHSITDFWGDASKPKNMPMARPEELRMWAEAKFLYS